MDPQDFNNLVKFISFGRYPVDIQNTLKYTRGNFRKKASDIRVEDILYKVRT